MYPILRRIVPVAVAAVAIVWWTIGLTVLQPLTEPAKPWHDVVGGNNTYWARDTRFTMIALAVVAFVWAQRGDRLPSGLAAIAAPLWVAVDVLLDRWDPTGPPTTVAIAAAGLAVLAVACWATRFRKRHKESRVILVLAAATAMPLIVVSAALESPSDAEPGLAWSGFVGAILATVVTLGCAAGAGNRPKPMATVAVFGAICFGLITVARLTPVMSGRQIPLLGLLLVSLLAVYRLTVRPRSAAEHLVTALLIGIGTVAVYCAGLAVAFQNTWVFKSLTAWAGNPPINAADEDFIMSVLGVGSGLAIGLVVVGAQRVAVSRFRVPADDRAA